MPAAPPPSRFEAAYEGTPPWDIGRPQRAFAALAASDVARSPLLDVGCGTGENALAFAARGLDVACVDLIPRAIEKAREKAAARGLRARFDVADALELGKLGRIFWSI